MPSRSTVFLAFAFAATMVSALSVTTLSVPGVQPTDAPDLVWSPIGTGADGRTTYAVQAAQSGTSDLGTFTATVALGPSDAVVYESEDGSGAVTESCAWAAGDSAATCVLVGPSVSGSVTVTGTETFTASVGAIPVTLAAEGPASTSGASSTSDVSGSESPATAGGGATDTGAVTNGPAPTAAPSAGSKTVASCAVALVAVAVSFLGGL